MATKRISVLTKTRELGVKCGKRHCIRSTASISGHRQCTLLLYVSVGAAAASKNALITTTLELLPHTSFPSAQSVRTRMSVTKTSTSIEIAHSTTVKCVTTIDMALETATRTFGSVRNSPKFSTLAGNLVWNWANAGSQLGLI